MIRLLCAAVAAMCIFCAQPAQAQQRSSAAPIVAGAILGAAATAVIMNRNQQKTRRPHHGPRIVMVPPRRHQYATPYRGGYRPQPFVEPKKVRVGPPKCEDGRFDEGLGRCVALKATHVDMPQAHKDYLANCPGKVIHRTIVRDGVPVEQQRCVR